MKDLLIEYLYLNKDLLLQRIRYIKMKKSDARYLQAMKKLKDFEDEHEKELTDSFLYQLQHEKEQDYYKYWIVMFYFYNNSDLNFMDQIMNILKIEKARMDAICENQEFVIDLFYLPEEVYYIKKLLQEDKYFYASYLMRHDRIISINNEVKKKIMFIKTNFLIFSDLLHIIRSDIDFSNIILTPEMNEQVQSLIKSLKEKMEDEDNEDDLFNKGVRGTEPVCLFFGFQGTGKTLTAYAIAHELNLPIIKLRTQKLLNSNMRDIFSELNQEKCIILIDDFHVWLRHFEHDEIFEILESSRNMIIITSNLMEMENIILPILRRITFKLTFPIPDKQLRKEIWLFHTPKGFVWDEKFDLDILASRYVLTGGNIKNIMMNYALFHKEHSRITEEELLPLIQKEIEKENYTDNYQIQIVYDFKTASTVPILNNKVLNQLYDRRQDIMRLKKNHIFVGLHSSNANQDMAVQLAGLFKKPVIIENPSLNQYKRSRYEGSKENLKPYFYDLLPRDDCILTITITSIVEELDKKTLSWPVLLLQTSLYKLLEPEYSQIIFVLCNNKEHFEQLKPSFDYFINLNRENVLDDMAGEKKTVKINYENLKFETGFNIIEFEQNHFNERTANFIFSFYMHLLCYYIIHGERPLSEKVVKRLFKESIPFTSAPLLFHD